MEQPLREPQFQKLTTTPASWVVLVYARVPCKLVIPRQSPTTAGRALPTSHEGTFLTMRRRRANKNPCLSPPSSTLPVLRSTRTRTLSSGSRHPAFPGIFHLASFLVTYKLAVLTKQGAVGRPLPRERSARPDHWHNVPVMCGCPCRRLQPLFHGRPFLGRTIGLFALRLSGSTPTTFILIYGGQGPSRTIFHVSCSDVEPYQGTNLSIPALSPYSTFPNFQSRCRNTEPLELDIEATPTTTPFGLLRPADDLPSGEGGGGRGGYQLPHTRWRCFRRRP